MAISLRFGKFSYVLTNYSRTLIPPLPQVGADLTQEIVLETKHNILMHNILESHRGATLRYNDATSLWDAKRCVNSRKSTMPHYKSAESVSCNANTQFYTTFGHIMQNCGKKFCQLKNLA